MQCGSQGNREYHIETGLAGYYMVPADIEGKKKKAGGLVHMFPGILQGKKKTSIAHPEIPHSPPLQMLVVLRCTNAAMKFFANTFGAGNKHFPMSLHNRVRSNGYYFVKPRIVKRPE